MTAIDIYRGAGEIGRGRLIEVLADHPPDPAATPLYAIYPPGPYIPPKVRGFVEFLGARLPVITIGQASTEAWAVRPARACAIQLLQEFRDALVKRAQDHYVTCR